MGDNVEKLKELVDSLEHMIASGQGSKEMLWFVDCTRDYLKGEYDTIDEALGLEED